MPRLDKSQHWISKTLEASLNTPEPAGANYTFLPTRQAFFNLPKLEKITDADRIGRNAPSHACNAYWLPSEITVADDVETDLPARLFRRALGGAVTDTVVSAAQVWDHEFAILPPTVGDDLPSFSMASQLASASFLLAGMAVDKFKMSQTKAARAQYEATLVNTGKFANPHGLVGLPALAPSICLDGFRTKIEYTDPSGPTTVDLGTVGRVIDWSVEHSNNIQREKRRTGDPILTIGNGSGAYLRKLPRGKYETAISLTLDFVDLADWTASVENKILENLKFTVVGPVITGAFRHEVEIIVPKFIFDTPATGDDEGDATTPISVIALEDPVSLGTITGRVRNASATLV